mgnify:CR=1 FL=1
MKFRTEISPEKSGLRIGYNTPLFFTGSCFSEEIGSYLERGKFDILINPFGVLYNPASVSDSLGRIIEGRKFTEKDLFEYRDRFLSLSHDTSFSGESPEDVLKSINSNLEIAGTKLKNAYFLFVTFGTARVYRLKSSGRIVSNCHKIPAQEFKREVLSVDEIASLWKDLIDKLREFNSRINIVFTLSPVRHWKDGAHGNQISKSILLLAIDRLMSEDSRLKYFPSYELMIDDLRDYRFYKDDLLHPSRAAVEYIWDYFAATYFEEDVLNLYREIENVMAGVEHRFIGNNRHETEAFKKNMLSRISQINKLYPGIKLDSEQEYFSNL